MQYVFVRFAKTNVKKIAFGTLMVGLFIAGYFKYRTIKKFSEQNPSPNPEKKKKDQFDSENQTKQISQKKNENIEQENNPQQEERKEDHSEFKIPIKCPLIEKIYDATCRARKVDQEFRIFVGPVKPLEYLLEEYGSSSGIRFQLIEKLNGMRRARGDGNCFYTSFGFQYLGFLLTESNDEIFGNFMRNVATQPWTIILEREEITQTQDLNIAFQQFCTEIRRLKKEERGAKFYELFSDPDCQLYGLTVIYLRNLAYNLCLQNEETTQLFEALGMEMKQQLLEWEFDCENNQSVIAQLSQKLQLTINFHFIDAESNKVISTEYTPENQQSIFAINLLFRPGHYNIAIPYIL